MTYEVSAAAKPPQTTPLYMGIRVDPREGNGAYRRRRAVGPRPHFLSHLSHFDGLCTGILALGGFLCQLASGPSRRFLGGGTTPVGSLCAAREGYLCVRATQPPSAVHRLAPRIPHRTAPPRAARG